ncbi:MAG: hypothetical protein OXC91_05455, partial [Rhodobacteraceae bacterium]|nr:hypothetical protein [Paracoccaceae bacterium]
MSSFRGLAFFGMEAGEAASVCNEAGSHHVGRSPGVLKPHAPRRDAQHTGCVRADRSADRIVESGPGEERLIPDADSGD